VAEPEEDIVLLPETIVLLRKADPGCPLCKWILEDFRLNGKLTDHPVMYDGKGNFPVKGKVLHVKLLKKIQEGRRGK
jgi:hypothetical protein